MPEGPQMVILKEETDQFIGQRITKADGDAKNIPFDLLEGQLLKDIKTFGKELLFCFANFTLRIHLMLFGKYLINGQLTQNLRLGLEFETGEINFYACDCRIITQPLDMAYDWETDVLNPSFNRKRALENLNLTPEKLICEALLDQRIFAGVGNKIKNEVLFRQQVHPESIVGRIPETKLIKLIDACITLSFEYLNWKHEGTEDENWKVYKKQECQRDNMPIIKEKIGKSRRSCYFCDKCQKLYNNSNF